MSCQTKNIEKIKTGINQKNLHEMYLFIFTSEIYSEVQQL